MIEIDISIIEYAKARYDEEQKRFEIIEQKASKLLSLMSALLATFVLLSSVVFDQAKKTIVLEEPLDYLLVINGCIVFLCLISSWGHALSCLKTGDCPNASSSRDNINYLMKTRDFKAVTQIVECYTVGTHELIEFNNNKSRNLSLSYNELKLSMVFIFTHTFLALGASL
ncbi:hypothetical protein FKQ62_12905 [Vibrio sp. B1-2]|uniref:hypothetical protein n=1 Tax=Vibrio sp. B1-2 TaxID=2591465 RepID=UPI001481FC3C|nr:hypothetical protein [Vibrio sp. B1-2]NNO00335.1 hypothetical protein [Vibrio sp. B1-2]